MDIGLSSVIFTAGVAMLAGWGLLALLHLTVAPFFVPLMYRTTSNQKGTPQ